MFILILLPFVIPKSAPFWQHACVCHQKTNSKQCMYSCSHCKSAMRLLFLFGQILICCNQNEWQNLLLGLIKIPCSDRGSVKESCQIRVKSLACNRRVIGLRPTVSVIVSLGKTLHLSPSVGGQMVVKAERAITIVWMGEWLNLVWSKVLYRNRPFTIWARLARMLFQGNG